VAGERWTVGTGKSHVPVDGPVVFSRPRLVRRLAEIDRRRLTMMTAAPGLGKTTLLAGWAGDQNCAWYTIGPDDRNPAVLARGLLEASRLRAPALDPDAISASSGSDALAVPVEGQGTLAADQIVGMLTERLVGGLTLVLDDAQELAESESSSRLLADVVRGGPSRLDIVLSSRTDPPFAVARLRAQGLAFDLSGSALRFSAAETAVLANRLPRGSLP